MYEEKYPEPEYPAEAAPVIDLTKFPEVAELLRRRPDLIATTAKCIICQQRSDMLGVFVVNTKHAAFYGAPPVKATVPAGMTASAARAHTTGSHAVRRRPASVIAIKTISPDVAFPTVFKMT